MIEKENDKVVLILERNKWQKKQYMIHEIPELSFLLDQARLG